MFLKKFVSLLIFVSLFLIPSGELGDVYRVEAQEVQPPGQELDERVDQDVADPKLIPQSPESEGLDYFSSLLGTDPNQGSRWVEVVIPASIPPEERSEETAAPYHPRPETSYLIERTERMVPGPHVLLLEADYDTPTASPILSLLQTYGDMGDVDMFDAHAATPTLSQLLPYDVVVTWSNAKYDNPTAIGNILADYVDAGGKVVNLMFSMGTHEWKMGGRFMTQGYTAMNGTDVSYDTHCLGSTNPSHPIMFGIEDVCDFYRISGTYLTAGSSSIAQWDDGLIFVAAKNNRSVVSINGYVGKYFFWTGQMPDVLHDAILWLVDDSGCNTVLYNNGPLITRIGAGYSNTSVSELQTGLGMNILGFGHQSALGYRIADEFTVTNPVGWQVEQFTFYAYQYDTTYTFPPTSTITGVYYQIWDGPPDDPGSQVIFGDLITNRLLESSWTHAYRVLDTDLLVDTRPIMANVASADVFLPPGTYWLDWMMDGSLLYHSGPYAPPITILGQTTTGNALQYVSDWGPALDSGTGTQQGMPFLVQGCKEQTAWQQISSNPIKLMDNVLAAYNNRIWSITGYGDPGVSNYDPKTGIWTKIASSNPPFGFNYARSGCQVGRYVYMYGDTYTGGFTGLWRYDMLGNTWTSLTPGNPGNAPASPGIWAPAWVLDSATNRCYLTGGATIPGNGDLNTVYVYNADANAWLSPLPPFTTPRDFHAAYLFTDPSTSHKRLCVAGGVNSSGFLNSTQCYDFTTSSWRSENSDLGSLPMPIFGSGYTQSPGVNGPSLWLVSGDSENEIVNQTWVFNVSSHAWIEIGPLESGGVFRTSAVSLNGKVYHLGGASFGFYYSGLSDRYTPPQVFFPLILK